MDEQYALVLLRIHTRTYQSTILHKPRSVDVVCYDRVGCTRARQAITHKLQLPQRFCISRLSLLDGSGCSRITKTGILNPASNVESGVVDILLGRFPVKYNLALYSNSWRYAFIRRSLSRRTLCVKQALSKISRSLWLKVKSAGVFRLLKKKKHSELGDIH